VPAQRYTTTVADARRGRGFVPVPFDPDKVWGAKPQHRVNGTVNGFRVRASIETHDGERGFLLGAAWLRDCRGIAVGDTVMVEIAPEGPQRDDLADDVAAALAASPEAGAFFDGLAQFYRKGYLRWIDATKRRPDLRAERIAEMVRLLESGIKERS
jgi:hypothetical protein